jgi:hypothetical protein
VLRARVPSVLVLVSVLAALSSIACGGDPPEKEMQAAQGAIEAARAAGADRYAVEELGAAETALTRADEAVAARDYRLALNYALDSRARANNAAKLAADGKAQARVEADRAITEAAAAVVALQARLKTPDVARLSARTTQDARTAFADGERRLQEARTAVDQGDYAAALAAASSTSKALAAARQRVDAAVAAASKRRR